MGCSSYGQKSHERVCTRAICQQRSLAGCTPETLTSFCYPSHACLSTYLAALSHTSSLRLQSPPLPHPSFLLPALLIITNL